MQDHHHRHSSFKIHSVAIQNTPEGDAWFKECENEINKIKKQSNERME